MRPCALSDEGANTAASPEGAENIRGTGMAEKGWEGSLSKEGLSQEERKKKKWSKVVFLPDEFKVIVAAREQISAGR